MPKVSVIVPNYNHEAYLRQRIDSVLAQTRDDFEVILLDDCSTDASLQVMESYREHPKVRELLVNGVNSGSAFRQWARGIARAAGDYLWIAESDDEAGPELLSVLCGVLDTKPNVGIAYCQSLKIDESGAVIGSWKDQTRGIPSSPWNDSFMASGREMLRSFFLFNNVIPNASAVVFRKQCLTDSIPREAATYTINGDWYVWSSMLLDSDLAFVNLDYSACRIHPQKGSTLNVSNFNNIAEFYRLRAFLHEALALSDEEREDLNAGLFAVWMGQRRSRGLSKSAPETLKVLAAAAVVDARVNDRLEREAT